MFTTRKSVAFVHGDISYLHGLLFSFLVNIRKTKGTPLCVLIQLLLQQQQGMHPVKSVLVTKRSRNFIISRKNIYDRVHFSNVASYNQFHNILRLLDVLPNFLFTTSETMGHYYLET